jgi:hypothetical protein
MKQSLSGFTVAIYVAIYCGNICGNLLWQYMFPLMNLILNNQENLHKSLSLYSINAGNMHYFHRTVPTLHVFRKGHSNPDIKYSRVYCLASQVLGTERHNLK